MTFSFSVGLNAVLKNKCDIAHKNCYILFLLRPVAELLASLIHTIILIPINIEIIIRVQHKLEC